MNLKPNRAQLILSGFIFGIVVVSLTFQNCSNQDFDNTLTQPSASKVDATNMDQIPFAFDFQPSQIAYMSCSRTNDKSQTTSGLEASKTHLSDPNVFFTFKLGAYDSGGLTLRQEFIDHVKTNFTFKSVLSDTEIQDALSYGTAHGGATLQLAIRESTPIATQISYLGTSGPTQGASYQLFPQNVLLTFKEFLPQLTTLFKNPSIRLTSLGSSSLQTYAFEGAIHEENLDLYNELTAEETRKKLQSSAATLSTLLSVTYSQDLRLSQNSSNLFEARKSDSTTSENRVWGKGYKMTFTSDGRMRWKQNVIASLTEYDLSTFEPSNSNWTCPAYFRFMIVSPQDRGTPITTMLSGSPYTFTFTETSEATLNPTELAIYTKVRRNLSSSEWMIDWNNAAVSPRRTNIDCYGNRAFNSVDYSGNDSRCGLDDNNIYLHKDCAEFVSICIRQ